MNPWLKGNMFGMPRWAWLALLAAGVAAGLYLRNRNKQQQAAAAAAGGDAIDPATGLPYSSETQAYDPALDPSLAGQGAYPQGSGGGGYQNSYAEDLLSQLLSQQGASANTPDDVATALSDFEAQQADYDKQLQDAITQQNKELEKQIKKQQKQLQKEINKLRRHPGAKAGKGKKHRRGMDQHLGAGQQWQVLSHHAAQGHHRRYGKAHGRTHENTPTGGGPPAHPPHAHMPVHHRHHRRRHH